MSKHLNYISSILFPQKGIGLNIYIEKLIDEKIYSKDYSSSLKLLIKRIDEFSKIYNVSIRTDTLSKSLLNKFINFMRSDTYQLQHNTICTYFSRLKTVLSRAQADGYLVNISYKDIILKPEQNSLIYLSEDELLKIYNCPQLSDEANRVRDAFLIQSYTGLRISDFSNLLCENINIEKNIIYKKAKKNRKIVKIPIHWIVREILEKYDYKLPKLPSIQAYNYTIKRICKKAGITDKIVCEYEKGMEYKQVIKEKYELVSSHTARRSFATNLFIAGLPLPIIMLFTGHKTVNSLLMYINITNEDIFQYAKTNTFFYK
ncbi:tyrosine-type recombinase/integrase [Gabonia massiliensis]|uniref:tyrosine-type recombinase/integrase n=1 Tax=Gabonia massiliensis TaxID=1686296 RepID=UPI0006D78937|nr:site-specific integrase [Gabonia massiliensis]